MKKELPKIPLEEKGGCFDQDVVSELWLSENS